MSAKTATAGSLALAVASLAGALTLSTPAGAAATDGAAATTSTGAPVPTLSWAPCQTRLGPFECTNARVPLDYDDPTGATISLRLAKLPAADPARKIGTIFLNPGGPGGSGVEIVFGAAPALFTPEVRARFDIVGFDPRGISRSTPLTCVQSAQQLAQVTHTVAFPRGEDEIRAWRVQDRRLSSLCSTQAGVILDHMSTGDVARDLDVLRAAVGDPKLTYVGFSYGSILGATYANLFPQRVRALVIDGVLDPVEWATGRNGTGRTTPTTDRVGSAAGAEASLQEFFRLCDEAGPDRCALAPGSAARYEAVLASVKANPLVITDPLSGATIVVIDDRFVLNQTLGGLYSASSFPLLAQFVAQVEAGNPFGAGAAANRLGLRSTGVEAFNGVICADTVEPKSLSAWTDPVTPPTGHFDELWRWGDSGCRTWPGSSADAYRGPFDAPTATPVLVMNTSFDPATPIKGARASASTLGNTAFVEVTGWGHTTLFSSTCAEQVRATYLLRRTAPKQTVCAPDVSPFDLAPAGSASARTSAAASMAAERDAVMPLIGTGRP